jgi:centrosomal protein CEP112
MNNLKEQLIYENSLRKQQIIELGALREDEKLKLMREHEQSMESLRTKCEHEKSCLRELINRIKETKDEELRMEILNVTGKLNENNKELFTKVNGFEQHISELKTENAKIADAYKLKLDELCRRHELEKNQLKQGYTIKIKVTY